MGYTLLNKGEKDLIFALQKFENFLMDNNIEVFTDEYKKQALELLPFVKEINGRLYTGRILLKKRFGSRIKDDLSYEVGIEIQDDYGIKILIDYKNSLIESGGNLHYDVYDSKLSIDYQKEGLSFKKSSSKRERTFARQRHSIYFLDSIFMVDVPNEYDIYVETCGFDEKYFFTKRWSSSLLY